MKTITLFICKVMNKTELFLFQQIIGCDNHVKGMDRSTVLLRVSVNPMSGSQLRVLVITDLFAIVLLNCLGHGLKGFFLLSCKIINPESEQCINYSKYKIIKENKNTKQIATNMTIILPTALKYKIMKQIR